MIRLLWEDWKEFSDAPKTAFMAVVTGLISGAMTFDLIPEDPAIIPAWPIFLTSIVALIYSVYRLRGGTWP
jgi:hypothetical protein